MIRHLKYRISVTAAVFNEKTRPKPADVEAWNNVNAERNIPELMQAFINSIPQRMRVTTRQPNTENDPHRCSLARIHLDPAKQEQIPDQMHSETKHGQYLLQLRGQP